MGHWTHCDVCDCIPGHSTLANAEVHCIPGLKPAQQTLTIGAGYQVRWRKSHAVFLLEHGCSCCYTLAKVALSASPSTPAAWCRLPLCRDRPSRLRLRLTLCADCHAGNLRWCGSELAPMSVREISSCPLLCTPLVCRNKSCCAGSGLSIPVHMPASGAMAGSAFSICVRVCPAAGSHPPQICCVLRAHSRRGQRLDASAAPVLEDRP